MSFCKYLSQNKCELLGEICFRLKEWKPCVLSLHYELLSTKPRDPPLTTKLKQNLKSKIIERWKEYAKRGAPPGMKGMTGGPLEEEVIKLIKLELADLGVEVAKRRKLIVLKNIRIIPDGIIKKEGKPISLLSIKSWIGPGGTIRDILGYGLLAKRGLGELNVKVYAIALHPYALPDINEIIEVYRPYIDGIYFISSAPYIDDLIRELKKLYA
ncbi:MAG: hypothetical protein J7L07_04100 [Candidatus Odinarchaeota archaeon]|nr:hypothetical protein [Candidatus Odinarchaeota archaeon]